MIQNHALSLFRSFFQSWLHTQVIRENIYLTINQKTTIMLKVMIITKKMMKMMEMKEMKEVRVMVKMMKIILRPRFVVCRCTTPAST